MYLQTTPEKDYDFPPIGDAQIKVFHILVKHGYRPTDIQFKQKTTPHGWLYVRRNGWREISDDVLADVRTVFPEAYMDFDNDKDFTRHELVLKL